MKNEKYKKLKMEYYKKIKNNKKMTTTIKKIK